MKTLLKVLGGLVLLVVVLVGAAIVIVPRLIDADDLKAKAVQAVKEQTGRELRIPGDVSVSVFPWLGLDVGEVALGNPAGFAGDTFARIERLTVRLQLMPLLSSQVVMDTVVLHGLRVHLARDGKGAGNWEGLGGEGGKDGSSSGGSGGGSGGGDSIATLAIGGLDVRDAALSYEDAASGERYALDHLALVTGAVELGKPVSLEMSFDLSGGKPVMQGRVEVAGTVAVDGQRLSVDGLTVKTALAGEALPGGKLDAAIAASLSADHAAQTAELRDLVVETLGLKLTGGATASGLGGAEPKVGGRLDVASFNPRDVMTALGIAPPTTADLKALTAMQASLDFEATPKAVRIAPLSAKLDDTTLKGTVAVTDLARQALRFDLVADAIDADRYLPPPAAEPAPVPAVASGQSGTAEAVESEAAPGLPMETLRALDIEGKLALGSLRIKGLRTTDIVVPVKAKDGVIRLAPLAAKLYEGTFAGDVTLDARGKQPKIAIEEQLAGVQAGPLLDDLQGGEGALEGTGDVRAKLTMTGIDERRIRRTLNGDVSFSFRDGAVRGVNIAQTIRNALAMLRGGAEDADAPRRTDFAELSGSARIEKGIVTNEDLTMKSPLLRIAGKGTADLPQDTVDYRVTATLVATSQGQGGKELDQLAGVPVPVRVTGPLAAPSFSPDLEALGAALAKSKAGEIIDQQKGAVTEKLKESVGGALGGVLGGGGTTAPAGDGQKAADPAGDAVNKLKGLFGN